MTRVPPTMMKPTGWFQIGWSIDFPLGHIAAKHHFGEEVVVFRTDDGRLRALDAYCGHMGAHLGHGGELCGDRVVCPFHGWEWNGDGRNVSIPYQDRPNRAVRIRSWPVMEQNGIVYLWHHRAGSEPSWTPPDVFDALGAEVAGADYHPAHPDGHVRFGALALDPFVVVDNAADPAHFKTVHETKAIPVVVSSEPAGHLFRVKLGFGSKWVTDPANATGDALDILQVGVGLSFTALGSPTNPHVVIVLATTPIDDETSEMFQTVWLERADGDDEPGRLAQRMHDATHQLPRDIEIWEHQRYVEHPAWSANEVRGFTAIRRWAASFCSSN
ncbi:MAG TPA: Rieske 2Fe-2S domain-containing protein [Acidimicrobiia bacterium]|nr:Rieske 2Fe-2S domain-containing protein [Acidimicrobiia bacterium]